MFVVVGCNDVNNDVMIQECSIEVLRQIWQVSDGLFEVEVMPLLKAYSSNIPVDYPAYEMCEGSTIDPRKR